MDKPEDKGIDSPMLHPRFIPRFSSESWVAIFAIIGVWFPAMATASYAWTNGTYYDYGWFIPIIGIFLLLRRWDTEKSPVQVLPIWFITTWILIVGSSSLLLRSFHYADPLWRLPAGVLGMLALIITHVAIGLSRGWRVSLNFWLITGLCLSSIPWSIPIETLIVKNLTHAVITTTSEIFQLYGKPVIMSGDQLHLNGITVEVTDGCSGIRSFQSFLMATFFFAELQRLRITGFITLLFAACATAFAINVARTLVLADVRFTKGEAAFANSHDTVGLLAFVISSSLFYYIAGLMSSSPRRKMVKTVQNT